MRSLRRGECDLEEETEVGLDPSLEKSSLDSSYKAASIDIMSCSPTSSTPSFLRYCASPE